MIGPTLKLKEFLQICNKQVVKSIGIKQYCKCRLILKQMYIFLIKFKSKGEFNESREFNIVRDKVKVGQE